jgi:hypothetical protein
MNVEIGLRPRNSFSGNICFEFLALSLCRVGKKYSGLDQQSRVADWYSGILVYVTLAYTRNLAPMLWGDQHDWVADR